MGENIIMIVTPHADYHMALAHQRPLSYPRHMPQPAVVGLDATLTGHQKGRLAVSPHNEVLRHPYGNKVGRVN